MSKSIRIDISPGELIDRITILEIKSERIVDPVKLTNVRNELGILERAKAQTLEDSVELTTLSTRLTQTNIALWEIEDDIRECERQQDFTAKFIELARSVYRTNDQRSAVKRQINELCGSQLIEEKSYAAY